MTAALLYCPEPTVVFDGSEYAMGVKPLQVHIIS